jgi:hypothetical protein
LETSSSLSKKFENLFSDNFNHVLYLSCNDFVVVFDSTKTTGSENLSNSHKNEIASSNFYFFIF